MSDFNQLTEIGSKSIASTTHIPISHVENILDKKFDQFAKTQFFGFISILEREYKIELSSLKQEYLFEKAEVEIQNDNSFDIAESSSRLLENPKALLQNRAFMIGLGTVVTIALLFTIISFVDSNAGKEEKIEINNTAIDKAKKNLNISAPNHANVEEMMENNTVESAEFGQDEENKIAKTLPKEKASVSQEPSMPLYFRIVPKGRLWLGIIDTETHRRSVETISEPLELDAEKSWLVVTGYGHLDMDCGDETHKFREDRKLLFLYENGICQIIDKEEFRARNRGKLW